MPAQASQPVCIAAVTNARPFWRSDGKAGSTGYPFWFASAVAGDEH
jgi:hypothetical protein